MTPSNTPSRLQNHQILVLFITIFLLIVLSLVHLHLRYPDLILPGVTLGQLGCSGQRGDLAEGISRLEGLEGTII